MTRIDALRPPITAGKEASVNTFAQQLVVTGVGQLLPELTFTQREQIGHLLHHRVGIRDYFPTTSEQNEASLDREADIVLGELVELVDLEYDGLEEPFSQARRNRSVTDLLQMAAGQEYLLSGRNEIIVQVGENAFIRVDYIPSSFEGTGQVRIAYKDEETVRAFERDPLPDTSEYPLPAGFEPLYEVRGNSYMEGGRVQFDIRAIQAWAKDGFPGIANLRALEEERIYRLTGVSPSTNNPDLMHLESLLHVRAAAVGRFAENDNALVNRGSAIKDEKITLTIEDAVLLIGVWYLRKRGVDLIRGISSLYQPAGAEYRRNVRVRFRYDELFGRWFSQRAKLQDVYPWAVSDYGQQGEFYFQNFQYLPSTMISILAAISNA